MAKTWSFATPFYRLTGWLRFRGTRVDSFSMGTFFHPEDVFARLAEQALVHHHRFLTGAEREKLEEEFVLDLVTDEPAEQLIIARTLRRSTLGEMVDWAIGCLQPDIQSVPEARLDTDEKLQIPCIDFDRTRAYAELHGCGVTNPGFADQAFGAVAERVRFHLDEGGAKLVSETEYRGLSLPPRTIVCDGPFLVVALRRNAPRPFLAMWIETPDLLIRSS